MPCFWNSILFLLESFHVVWTSYSFPKVFQRWFPIFNETYTYGVIRNLRCPWTRRLHIPDLLPRFDEYITEKWGLIGARSHALPHAGFPCFKDAFVIWKSSMKVTWQVVSLWGLPFLKLPWQRLPGLQWYVGAFKVQQSEAMGLMVRKMNPWAPPKSSNKKQALWTIETRSKPSWHHDMTSHYTDCFFHVSLYWCFFRIPICLSRFLIPFL